MPPEPPGGTRPAGPVVLRIKLRYDDVDAMVSRFAPNVGKSGLFLPTKSLQPVGSEVKFELRLATDTPVLLGLGRVKVTKPPDPDNPKASFGMAIELMRVTRESRDLILRMLERRKQLGLPEVAIPLPSDLDAARRQDFVDTAVRDAASAPIPAAVATIDSGPAEASTGLLTAPRRASGPLAVQKAVEIEPLPPEPPRKKRPGLSELIERASGPVAALSIDLPGLDGDVDVAAVLARARFIAGAGGPASDLDSELEALRESQAAPIEIGVEAASAELARQLGGAAVRRGQSAPTAWAPPPEVAAKIELPVEAAKEQPPVEAPVEEQAEAPVEAKAEEVTPEPPVDAPKIEEPVALTEEKPPVEAAADEPKLEAPQPADTFADPDAAAAALDAADEQGEPEEEHEVEPEQIHDEIHQLGESDFEEVEHTHIGEVHSAFDEHVFATTPAMQSELADKLDAHLAEVESEGEHDDLGIGEASGHYLRSRIGLPPAEIYEGDDVPEPAPPAETPLPPEYQQDFIHRFDAAGYEPAASEYSEEPQAAYQDPAYPAHGEFAEPYADELPAGAQSYASELQGEQVPLGYTNETGAAPYQETIDAYGNTVDASMLQQPADEPEAEEPEEIEEIDDFEILAEADEADEDLLSSSGESEVSARHDAPTVDPEFSLPPPADGDFELPPQRESDFAMRLDLGDDEPGYDTPVPQPMDLAASAGHALAGFGEEEDPSHSFTFAEAPAPPETVEFDERHNAYSPGFTPPGRFDQSDVIPIAQSRSPSRRTAAPRYEDDEPVAPPPFHIAGPPPNVGWDEADPIPAGGVRNQWAKAPSASSEEIDLESALEALDVDLDDLSTPGAPVPHAPTELARAGSSAGRSTIRPPSQSQGGEQKRKSTRTPRGRAPRANTDDGVLIDFDDDDE